MASPIIDVDSLESAKPVTEEFLAITTSLQELCDQALSIEVIDVLDTANMQLARDTRLSLRQIRIAVENRRKELKAEYLEKGRKIDTAAKAFAERIEPLEARLLAQEEFAERLAAKRMSELQASRAAALRNTGMAEAMIPTTLAFLSLEEWVAALNGALAAEAARAAAAERAAAEQAAAQAQAEQDRQRLAEERAAAQAAQAEAVRVLNLANAEAEKARRATAEAEAEKARLARAEHARQVAETQAKYDAEQAEKERLAAIAEQERRAALAPDAEKIRAFAQSVRDIAPDLSDPTLASRLANGIGQFCGHLEKLAASV